MMKDNNLEELFVNRYLKLYPKEAASLLENSEPVEIAEALLGQPPEQAREILEFLTPGLAAECLSKFDQENAVELLSLIEPGRAALLLNLQNEEYRDRLLSNLNSSLVKELTDLMAYPPGTAGRLMNTRIFTFKPDQSVKEALQRYRKIGLQIRNLIVADETGKLLGLIPLAKVVSADWSTILRDLITTQSPFVLATSPREEAVEILSKQDITTLPVVDANYCVIGVLSHGALIQSVEEAASADVQTMVGVSKEERALSKPWFAIRKRLPWLNINLLTAFLAAAVVGLFENTIAQFTALAVLLPVVAGQSGNTGAQALAVVMRGLALREVRLRHSLQILSKEGLVGFINGIAIAMVTAAGVWIWSQSFSLSLIIAAAMIISMFLAGIAGASIPLVLTVLRQDPAQSGSIILTTITDVVGFMSFLGLATLFSSFL